MKRICILLLLTIPILLTILTACSSTNESSNSAEYAKDAIEFDEGGVAESSDNADTAGEPNEKRASQSVNSGDIPERKVINTGDISLEVQSYQNTQAFIQEEVEKLGGYVVESSLHHRSEEEVFGSLVVRVPQGDFHSFLNELESNSVKVLERSIRGNDVTEEYIDLQSRLKSKEVVEERLLSFMDEATTTEDLLNISNDLAKIQEEIEQLTGRIDYLDNQVDFSTINIQLHENNIRVSSLSDKESLNTWKNAQSLFMDTVNFIISFFSSAIVLFIGLSPVIIPLMIIIAAIFIVQRRRKRKE